MMHLVVMPGKKTPQLDAYREKRDPAHTPEPFGRRQVPATDQLFVVQQHAASHLHFDLRLEVDGVLKSWAVPKGPSSSQADKRFAVQTEDHPLDYATFEGEIPTGSYGAGHVIVWDRGRYTRLEDTAKDFDQAQQVGKLLFELHGHKLRGRWTLIKLKKGQTSKEWLLIKERDAWETPANTLTEAALQSSVVSGLSLPQMKSPTRKVGALTRKVQAHNKGKVTTEHPAPFKPMLATAGQAFNRTGWIWELKYDGYRALAHKQKGLVQLKSRNGVDLSNRFPEIVEVLARIPFDNFVLDGEVVVNNPSGRPDFGMMQQRARSLPPHQVAAATVLQPATYYCFDLLQVSAIDIRHHPLKQRKAWLNKLLPTHSHCVFSEHVANQGKDTFATARELGIEGVVGKKLAAPYCSGRSADWIKVRASRHDEFVIVGWSAARGNPKDIGSIALAEYQDGNLRYVGHAGSGLSDALRTSLAKKLARTARKTSPVQDAGTSRVTHWVRPSLVVEVAFTEYTKEGRLRHPVIQRLREDKSPTECTGQFLVAQSNKAPLPPTSTADTQSRVVTTNPDKVLFPKPGFTKADTVAYYRAVAPWLLPWLAERPIVLTRFPDGEAGKSFFQRDVPNYVPEWIRRETLWSEEAERSVRYFVIDSAEGLAYLANMATLPIHIWHSRITALDKPDWCVLDLDPKGADFKHVIRLAQAIGTLCDELALPCYVKTSGASGLHLFVPLARQLDHQQSRTLGELLAGVIVQRYPDIATVARTLKQRQGKVYVDFMQNGHGRLIAAPYCIRAKPEASVSMPLHWHEVNGGLRNSNYHIGNALRRLRRWQDNPWKDLMSQDVDLARGLQRLQKLLT